MSKAKSNTGKKRAKSTRSTVNNNWKKETFSMSALVRYAKSPKGSKDVQKLLDEMNAKHGTNVQLKGITTQSIVKHATVRELNKNAGDVKNYVKGEKKVLFSFWLVILTCGRLVQAAKSSKAVVKKAA